MKKQLFKLGTLGCLLALPVLAQQQQQQQQRSPFGSPALSPATNIAGVQAGVQASAPQESTISSPIVLNLSGTTVMDQSGQQLGQIQNLLISPGGCVDLAVLSLGGTKLVPIPWQLVAGSGAASGNVGLQGRTALVAKVDRQKLQQAPSFSINQLSQITQQQTIQQINNFFGVQGPNQNVGGTSSQTSGISGGSSSTNTASLGSTTGSTNQFGSQGSTNQFGTTNSGALSPTGRTNGYPGQPGFGSNTNTNTFRRPGVGLGRPENRPPDNRPPENRPPTPQPTPGQGQQ